MAAGDATGGTGLGALCVPVVLGALAVASTAPAEAPPSPSIVASHPSSSPADPSPAVAARAAYLYRFAPFVQWPDAAFDSPMGPFSICIPGVDPFGVAIDRVVNGQRVGQHAVDVKRPAKVDKSSTCHLLYLGGLKGPALAEAISAVKGAPVLTVTESQGPDDPRGMIDFRFRGRRVRFTIDQDAVRQSGLIVSSKLLDLAASMRQRRLKAHG